jgi:hypothetical protein
MKNSYARVSTDIGLNEGRAYIHPVAGGGDAPVSVRAILAAASATMGTGERIDDRVEFVWS